MKSNVPVIFERMSRGFPEGGNLVENLLYMQWCFECYIFFVTWNVVRPKTRTHDQHPLSSTKLDPFSTVPRRP